LQNAGLTDQAVKIINQFMASASLEELAEKLPALKDNFGWAETTQIS